MHAVHGNKYDYTNSVFEGTSKLLNIYCPVCEKEFSQRPNAHLKGQGCPKCGLIKRTKNRTKTLETFIKEAEIKHSNYYNYSKVVYINSQTKVGITCPTHGIFYQKPSNHLNGEGCPNCSIIRVANSQRITTEDFIRKAITVHGSKYDYRNTVFTHSDIKVTIKCNNCMSTFSQTVHNHLKGANCPHCSVGGFSTNKPALLYYFKVTDGVNTAWKIGITNLSIEDRYTKQEKLRMSDIISVWYENGAECYTEEQHILNEYRQYQYVGPDLLRTGNTELFNKDIFNLSKDN